MNSVLEMLAKIRERPGTILGRPSMRTLYAFLTGYTLALIDRGCDDYKILSEFGNFVTQRFRMMGVHGWAKIIEFQSPDDEYEMKLFWELLDEHLAKQAAKNKTKKKAARAEPKKNVA